jgi:hypothetical protein
VTIGLPRMRGALPLVRAVTTFVSPWLA